MEYLIYIVENKRELPEGLDSEKFVKIIDILRNYINKDKLDDYTQKYMNGEIAENLIRNSSYAKNFESFTEGIYVDVDGTLIQNNKLNQPLMDYLMSTINNVTIFTNGDIKSKTEELRNLRVPEKFLPVKAKDQYRGKLLEKVFDDQPLIYQGFDALLHISPKAHYLDKNSFPEYETSSACARDKTIMDKNGEELLEKFISNDGIIEYYPRFVAKKKAQLKVLKELKEIRNKK